MLTSTCIRSCLSSMRAARESPIQIIQSRSRRTQFTPLKYDPSQLTRTPEPQLTPAGATGTSQVPTCGGRPSDPSDGVLLRDAEIAIREAILADILASKKAAARLARQQRKQLRIETDIHWLGQVYRGELPHVKLTKDIKHFFERGEGFKAAGRNTELDHVESAQPVKNAKSSSMKTSANASRSSPILSAIVSLNGPDPNGVQTRLSTAFCNNAPASPFQTALSSQTRQERPHRPEDLDWRLAAANFSRRVPSSPHSCFKNAYHL